MWPILLKAGPITIYAFGFFLALMAVVISFLVWKQARSRGMSEEKIFDIWFLSLVAAVIIGRAGFIYDNWPVFGIDYSRFFLLIKYPGFSYQAGAIAGGVATILFSLGVSLDWLAVVDVFSLAILPASAIGYLGCYLDSCYGNPAVVLGLLIGALVLGVGINIFDGWLTRSPGLLEFSRRRGLFFLAHLIFLLVSFLILAGIASDRNQTVASLVALVVAVAILIFRYFPLISHFYHSAISKKRLNTD